MKRNKTLHMKADFYNTLCGYPLFKEDGSKTKCRATGNWKYVTCENCLKRSPITGADGDGE